ncbi:mitochondrial basic amino acids transporter [Macrosteles quadrilineatus]|uniref:mitochondrial basic amino acids transporter n=1 Tax=Macrosteles quadrilineatus TaxID=74068 RepID=UPI0023E283E1|nr:mitochondrial basic amino acids transporter [Macrosteles quadrilineatus]
MALDFIAGCLGGCAGVAVGHPFDTLKVKLQTQDFRNPVYRGTWDCFTKILQTESLAGFYRGVWSPMGGVALVNAIVFGVYGNLQRGLLDPESLRSQFLAGGIAGLAQSVVSSPVELVKTRMQTSSSYHGTVDCFMSILRSERINGVFKGLSVTAAREFLGYGFYFSTYEFLTRASPVPIGTPTMLLAGGISGTVSWVMTYPLDVVKTRFQADIGRYSGLVDCLKKSIANEGLSCLSRGLMPTIFRAFPTNAVTFTVVTWVMRYANVSTDGSTNVSSIVDSVVETIPKEKHVINTMLDEHLLKFNWPYKIKAQRYFLMSEDLWVGDELFNETVNTNLPVINTDAKLDADLLAAEQKMIIDLAQELQGNDYDAYLKTAQRKEEYKENNR